MTMILFRILLPSSWDWLYAGASMWRDIIPVDFGRTFDGMKKCLGISKLKLNE